MQNTKKTIKQFFCLLSLFAIFLKYLRSYFKATITSNSDITITMYILNFILLMVLISICFFVFCIRINSNVYISFNFLFALYLTTTLCFLVFASEHFALKFKSWIFLENLNKMEIMVLIEFPHLYTAEYLKNKVYVPCSEVNFEESPIDDFLRCSKEAVIEFLIQRSLKLALFWSYLAAVLLYKILFGYFLLG
jgi:hypothetical protein